MDSDILICHTDVAVLYVFGNQGEMRGIYYPYGVGRIVLRRLSRAVPVRLEIASEDG